MWLGVRGGCTSPFRGSFGNSCCNESRSQKVEGAPACPLLPPTPQSRVSGSHKVRAQTPGGPNRGPGGGAVRCIPAPVDVRCASLSPGLGSGYQAGRAGPAGFAQLAERGGREWSPRRCAALRCAALGRCARRQGPSRGSTGPISRPFGSPLRSLATGKVLPQKVKRLPGSQCTQRPSLGVSLHPFCSRERPI
jgi:hypothetical protein